MAQCSEVGKGQPIISRCSMPLDWKGFKGLKLHGAARFRMMPRSFQLTLKIDMLRVLSH